MSNRNLPRASDTMVALGAGIVGAGMFGVLLGDLSFALAALAVVGGVVITGVGLLCGGRFEE